jgi:type II secretory pathway component GspD/PulD (secretin)
MPFSPKRATKTQAYSAQLHFRPRLRALLFMLVISALSPSALAQQLQLEIIPLKHRPAATLIEQLRPLVKEPGSITASGNQLIIRSNRDELAQLHLLIDELDTPLAQVLISVRHGDRVGVSTKGYNTNSTITSGKSTITIGNDGNQKRISKNGGLTTTIDKSTAIINRSTGSRNNNQVSQVRATEGYPAYIHTGQQVPITTRSGYGYQRQYDQEYKDVLQGFYVTPRLVGENTVTLQIRVTHDQVKDAHKRDKTIETQGYQSTISGQLGQWISLGGINLSDNKTDSGLGRSYSTKRSQDMNLYLKIDEIK